MKERKYLPTLAELIDRLSITQLKEVFMGEHKKEYAEEMKAIMHDIDLILNTPLAGADESCSTQYLPASPEGGVSVSASTIRAIIVVAQMNLHIWHNESEARKGVNAGENLRLTHGLNGIRNTAKNKIQELVGGRKDYKIDCLASEFKDWEISWNE